LKKPSLIDAIEGIKRLMEIALLFNRENESTKSAKGKNKDPRNSANKDVWLQQIDAMLKALTQSASLELIGDLTDLPEIKVALNAEINYFNNKTANEAIDGEFNILGKIIRVIKPESTDTINLLRNTSFRQLDLKLFNDFAGALKEAEGSGLNLPEIVTEIKAPAIQILPIAIFT